MVTKESNGRTGRIRALVFVLWFLFTVSLTGWWFVFAVRQVDRIAALEKNSEGVVARKHRMLVWEGAVLVLSLVAGAAGLGALSYREIKSREQMKKFLATFTHELKTPLASLRLQAESLREQEFNSRNQVLLERLLSDTARLALQLENSLWLASSGGRRFLVEDLVLGDCLSNFMGAWPGLELKVSGDARLNADRRAIESIFQNLVQNAVVHGRATQVRIETLDGAGGTVKIIVSDNGKGFSGDIARLGKLYERHSPDSGSGIGLYIVKDLTSNSGGTVVFHSGNGGFSAEIELPGRKL